MGGSLQGPEVWNQPKCPPVSGPGSFWPLSPAVFWREECVLCTEQTLTQAMGVQLEEEREAAGEGRELRVPQIRTQA